MRFSPRNVRIGGSILIALLLITGAYVLPGLDLPKTREVNAELTDDLLANYVSKDTDGDNLPDWQEALYGTDVNRTDTDGDGITDGEAVRRGLLTPNALASQIPEDPIGEEDIPGEAPAPGSITDAFGRAFLEAYLSASGGEALTEEEQEALTGRLLADFAARASKALASSYTNLSLRTSTSLSTMDYVASVERVLRSHTAPSDAADPIALMQDLLEENDAIAAGKLAALAVTYNAIAQDLLTTEVPPALADEHLKLVRSFDSLARATNQVTKYEKDPLGVLGALTIYPSASKDVTSALQNIAAEVTLFGEPAAGAPGAYILNAARYSQQQP